MQIASHLSNILGVFVFLFIFWKRQKEDFSSEIIFKSAFYILTGIGAGYLTSYYFLKDYWLWLAFIGGSAGMLIANWQLRTKFHEAFEAFIVSSLPWLGITFLLDSVVHSSLSSFLGFIVILIIIFVSYWLDANYKAFGWYRSGRIGFSGVVTLGILFLVRFGIAIFRISVLSFVGKFEPILSGIGILVSFAILISLGRIKE